MEVGNGELPLSNGNLSHPYHLYNQQQDHDQQHNYWNDSPPPPPPPPPLPLGVSVNGNGHASLSPTNSTSSGDGSPGSHVSSNGVFRYIENNDIRSSNNGSNKLSNRSGRNSNISITHVNCGGDNRDASGGNNGLINGNDYHNQYYPQYHHCHPLQGQTDNNTNGRAQAFVDSSRPIVPKPALVPKPKHHSSGSENNGYSGSANTNHIRSRSIDDHHHHPHHIRQENLLNNGSNAFVIPPPPLSTPYPLSSNVFPGSHNLELDTQGYYMPSQDDVCSVHLIPFFVLLAGMKQAVNNIAIKCPIYSISYYLILGTNFRSDMLHGWWPPEIWLFCHWR